ncbi:MAG TPA: DUF2231 domain-containing protein, partial [bacterium]|nr:DUF2231 domain-containing protein [bacterium]
MKQLRVLGHPAHVPLTHFPLALWTLGFVGDLLFWWRQDPFWWHFSFWNIALGLGIGSLTLVTGFYDYFFIPEGRPLTLDAATRHMMVMLTAASCFGVSLYFHRGEATVGSTPQILALASSGIGTLFLHWGGWLGG